MDRREAIKLVSKCIGGAVSLPVASAILAGCSGTSADHGQGGLGSDQLSLAGVLAERIIPTTDTPGALAAGVDQYINQNVALFFDSAEKAIYLKGLDEVNQQAKSLFGARFSDCSQDQQNHIVGQLDQLSYGEAAQPDNELAKFFRFQKEMTIAGYYTSEIGQTQELHIAPFGSYEADVPFSDIGKAWA